MDINWDLLKFKYEVLGESLEQIASENDVILSVLQHTAQEWKTIPVNDMKEVNLQSLTSFDEIVEKLQSNTISQVKAFQLLKDRFLATKLIDLESTVLAKTLSLAQGINLDDPKAAQTLRTVTTILTALKDEGLKPETDDLPESREWKITVVDAKEESVDGS